MYNTTNITSSTDISSLAIAANQTTQGMLFTFFLVAVFIVLLLALKRFDFLQTLLVTGWVMFTVSTIFWFGGLITIYLPLLFLAIAGFVGLYFVVVDRS